MQGRREWGSAGGEERRRGQRGDETRREGGTSQPGTGRAGGRRGWNRRRKRECSKRRTTFVLSCPFPALSCSPRLSPSAPEARAGGSSDPSGSQGHCWAESSPMGCWEWSPPKDLGRKGGGGETYAVEGGGSSHGTAQLFPCRGSFAQPPPAPQLTVDSFLMAGVWATDNCPCSHPFQPINAPAMTPNNPAAPISPPCYTGCLCCLDGGSGLCKWCWEGLEQRAKLSQGCKSFSSRCKPDGLHAHPLHLLCIWLLMQSKQWTCMDTLCTGARSSASPAWVHLPSPSPAPAQPCAAGSVRM